jgi:hypothetical protein
MTGAAAYLGPAILGWDALAVALFATAGASLFVGENLSSGVGEDRDNRGVIAVFAAIGLLDGFLPAWTDRQGFWTIGGEAIRCLGVGRYTVGAVLRLWPLAVLGQAVQRAGGHPARAHAGHQRRLWRHPSSQLSGAARQFARLGACLSFGRRRTADGAHHPSAPRAHSRGGKTVALVFRRGLCHLPRSNVAADPRALLKLIPDFLGPPPRYLRASCPSPSRGRRRLWSGVLRDCSALSRSGATGTPTKSAIAPNVFE